MSVEFEPVKLGRRRRRVDPVLVGALAVVVAIGAAVAKPWEPRDDRPGGAAEIPVATTTGTAAADLPGPSTRTTIPPGYGETDPGPAGPSWARLAPVMARHEDWGIRAIVVDPDLQAADLDHTTVGYAEYWFPAPGAGDGDEVLVEAGPDRSVLALGLTYPPDETPLDARIWREVAGRQLEWVDARAIEPTPSGGALLFIPPAEAGASVRSWSPGRYRVDALVNGAVRRFSLAVVDRAGNVPMPPPASVPDTTLPSPHDADLEGLPEGLFAAVDGVGVHLAAEASAGMLHEAEAWLDADPGTGRAPRSRVASAYLPRATGLGVMLPTGSIVRGASVRRLASDRRFDGPPAVGGGLFDHRGRGPYILLAAPGAGAWTPGVYALSVTWKVDGTIQSGTWHVELRPGPVAEVPRLLAAVRGWSRYAGASGVILGTTEPLEGGPRSATIRLLRAIFPATNGTGCDGPRIEGRPAVIGFAHGLGELTAPITARAFFPGGRSHVQPLLTMREVVPGLVVIAPADGADLGPATYRFTFGDGAAVRRITVCLGSEPSVR